MTIPTLDVYTKYFRIFLKNAQEIPFNRVTTNIAACQNLVVGITPNNSKMDLYGRYRNRLNDSMFLYIFSIFNCIFSYSYTSTMFNLWNTLEMPLLSAGIYFFLILRAVSYPVKSLTVPWLRLSFIFSWSFPNIDVLIFLIFYSVYISF